MGFGVCQKWVSLQPFHSKLYDTGKLTQSLDLCEYLKWRE